MSQGKGALGLVLAAAILGGVVWVGLMSSDGEGQQALTLAQRYEFDGRLDPLIYDCEYGRTFDEQTADMIPHLVSKLENGTRDPLRQSKRELGAIGGPAVPELTRLFDKVFDDKWRHGVVENVLAACTLMEGPDALPLLRRAMTHPLGAIRLAALPGLGRHGDEGDYDIVRGWLDVASTPQLKARYAQTLQQLDEPRYFDDLAEWLTLGQHPALWQFAMLSIADCHDPVRAQRFKDIAPLRDDQFTPFLLAPAAALGDADAMEEIQGRLRHERPGTRQLAVQALAAIGHTADIADLVKDVHSGVRLLVVDALRDDDSELATQFLREATKDANQQVRETALIELVSRADELALAEVLNLLDGNVVERELAVRALRDTWDQNPGAAERAYERLMEQWRRQQEQPAARISVLQALANLPLEEAATFLLDFGRQFEGEVKGQRAHRWACGQVWNTGEVGRGLLRSAVLTEPDPFRRLDLIEFIWQDHSEASRECLLGLLRDDSLDWHERLYVADRLTRIGPASVVAPAIKRVYLACEHRTARPALQCLLWTFYGQHYF